ncbi:MAG TPA: fibronectin type III domain-containing protein, partial [Deferrisomatales bacterium]|nr:fibronectin type III domain-containing protein [Deferrisomatales bacterium]
MISFDVRRDASSKSDKSGAIPVRFLDGDGRGIFILRVDCAFDKDPARAALRIRGRELRRHRQRLWDPLILLDKKIEPGERLHFDLTWDDEAREYNLFVDGRAVNPRPDMYSPAQKAYGYSAGELTEEGAGQPGEPPPYPNSTFGSTLAAVRTIVVGDTLSPSDIRGNPIKRALVSDASTNNVIVAVDEPVAPVTKIQEPRYDVAAFSGTYSEEGVRLTWQPPQVHGINQGYYVYRRSGAGNARFEKLTPERVYALTYLDSTAVPSQIYRYSVTAVYADGKGGDVESSYPPEIIVAGSDLYVTSVAAEKLVYGAGQEIVATLRGPMDGKAVFTIEGITPTAVAMREIDDGVYVGTVAVPAGLNLPAAALTATLTDPAGGAVLTLSGGTLAIDSLGPGAVPRILATVPWAGEIELAWDPSPAADVAEYRVYRG